MRLWHQSLIPHLPRQQLLGQHRECCALRGAGWLDANRACQSLLRGSCTDHPRDRGASESRTGFGGRKRIELPKTLCVNRAGKKNYERDQRAGGSDSCICQRRDSAGTIDDILRNVKRNMRQSEKSREDALMSNEIDCILEE